MMGHLLFLLPGWHRQDSVAKMTSLRQMISKTLPAHPLGGCLVTVLGIRAMVAFVAKEEYKLTSHVKT